MLVRNMLAGDTAPEALPSDKGWTRRAYLYGAGDLDTPLRFVRHTVLGPGARIGYHQHGDDEEIFVVLEGGGLLTVNGEQRRLVCGDVVLNKPWWSHGLDNDTGDPLRLLIFEIAM